MKRTTLRVIVEHDPEVIRPADLLAAIRMYVADWDAVDQTDGRVVSSTEIEAVSNG